MDRPSAPPSRAPRSSREQSPTERGGRRVDVRDWVGGIRMSGFMGIMLGLVVLAAFVLVPTIGTYVDQRQQIAALTHDVEATKDEITELTTERERWRDEAYIVAQARERLYYRRPGEVVYLVADDLPTDLIEPSQRPVSDDVQETQRDWMTQFLRSVTEAGLAETVAPD
ncbi:FtsB family cell division protein [Microbacterium oleivorans]|uniref:FtsB family cell division protein n=1 Tax=Microbacterium oleivorans TaxID=273677 RepID=UPI0020407BA6|nr:septum formation initiator family protein [Microbacterium oleivorans]MCM3696174.1 septum formation initiator family protein [Microbacterium oleivorans]